MCQGEDRAVETPGGAGGGKVQALNLREPAQVSGSGSGSVVCTQQTGLQEPPGDRPSKAGGEKATAGQQRQRPEDPSRGTTGQEIGSTSLTMMFHCILETNTLAYLKQSSGHFVMYENIKSLCCAQGTNIVL